MAKKLWTVEIVTTPMLDDPNECMDYENEFREYQAGLSLQEVIDVMAAFCAEYPYAEWFGKHFGGDGLFYEEDTGHGKIWHEINIYETKVP
jgi:hypothetical protein